MPDNNNTNDNVNNSQSPFTPFTPADNTPVQDDMMSSNVDFSQAQQSQNSPTPPEEEYPKDERIVDYLITQVIPAKNPEMPADQVTAEMERLYKILENGIFETAYNQLDENHKNELDTLMKYGADIPAIQAFFIEKIPNIQVQLGKYMEDFVQKYLKGEV